MPTSTLSARGRITIPKSIRQRLALQPGDRLEFRVKTGGMLVLEPVSGETVGRVPGLLRHLAKEDPVSLDEMDEGIQRLLGQTHKGGMGDENCYTSRVEETMQQPSQRELLRRIRMDPEVMLGKPVIRGTRITVEILLERLASGASMEQILTEYPDLHREDILAALAYARSAVGTDELIAEPA